MPTLICYVPFDQHAAAAPETGDLRRNADELMAAQSTLPRSIGGLGLQNRRVVYEGQEQANQAQNGDVIVVCAHGAPDDTDLSDNAGNWITQAELLQRLRDLNAAAAAEVYFFACHSAERGHIAPTFRQAHPAVRVYGTSEPAQGALVSTSRSKLIRSAVWSSGQLREI